MSEIRENQALPPKEPIEQLVTVPADVEKVIKGVKTASRRQKRFADVGDIMNLQGQQFVVERIYQQTLEEVTEEDARKEGYDSLEAYKESILSLHPGITPWLPKIKVWVHEYKKIQVDDK